MDLSAPSMANTIAQSQQRIIKESKARHEQLIESAAAQNRARSEELFEKGLQKSNRIDVYA